MNEAQVDTLHRASKPDGKTKGRALKKHPLPQRLLHWFNAVSFLFLWVTGVGLITSPGYRLAPELFTRTMAWLFGGPVGLLHAHITVGVLWFGVLSAAFLLDPFGLSLRFLRDLRLTRNDLAWLKLRARAELREDVELPPQGAYNAGQKAFGWTVLLGIPVIGATGILLVVGTGGGAFSQWMVFLHLLAVGGVIAFFIVHFSMSTLMREERPALRSMFTGDVDADYARHHHEEWYASHATDGGEHVDRLERFGLPRALFKLLAGMARPLLAREEKPLWSPYTSGALIGVSVLAAFLLLGHGLGASGLFSRLGANMVATVAEDRVRSNAFWAPALDESLMSYWLLWMGLGTLLGGLLSAVLAGRVSLGVDRGALISPRARIILALFGGALVGLATRLTRGCTSQQALSGGSLLSTGSWVFVLAVFGGGFLTAFFLRRVWR